MLNFISKKSEQKRPKRQEAQKPPLEHEQNLNVNDLGFPDLAVSDILFSPFYLYPRILHVTLKLYIFVYKSVICHQIKNFVKSDFLRRKCFLKYQETGSSAKMKPAPNARIHIIFIYLTRTPSSGLWLASQTLEFLRSFVLSLHN